MFPRPPCTAARRCNWYPRQLNIHVPARNRGAANSTAVIVPHLLTLHRIRDFFCVSSCKPPASCGEDDAAKAAHMAPQESGTSRVHSPENSDSPSSSSSQMIARESERDHLVETHPTVRTGCTFFRPIFSDRLRSSSEQLSPYRFLVLSCAYRCSIPGIPGTVFVLHVGLRHRFGDRVAGIFVLRSLRFRVRIRHHPYKALTISHHPYKAPSSTVELLLIVLEL